MKFKIQTILLFLFLSTGIFNNSFADTITSSLDSIKGQNNLFDDEIEQFAEDSLKINIEQKKAFLYGNAKIKYQNITITAAYIEINWNQNTIYASYKEDSIGNKIGEPVFTEGKDSFGAEEITYNFNTKKCKIKKIITKEGEGYILGKTVKKVDEDIFYLNKGDYTTCDAKKPHFSIRANRVKVIAGKKIITGPAHLTFFGIPTPLFFPFGYFPNNNHKSSGIIMPSYGESTNMGFFLKDGGYYFTISEKIDLSLKSDIYTQGSWNLKSMLRYKSRYKYSGSINLNYGNMKNSYVGFPDYSEKKDFNIRWSHQQDAKANPSVNFSANVEAGSSTYHRNNSYNDDYLKNTMSSNINLTKSWNQKFFQNLNVSLRHSQNMSNNNINLTLPEISLNSKRIYPFKLIGNSTRKKWYDKISIKYDMNTRNTISTMDSLLFTKNSFSKFRNGMKHNIPISATINLLKYFNFTQNINLTERWYLNQIRKSWNQNNSTLSTDTINKFTRAYDYSITSGINTKIYGLVEFKKGKLAGLRHVISPSLSFRYNPDFSNEKYGYYKTVQINENGDTQGYSIMQNGIYGSPSNQKNGNINFSLGNILDMKIRSKKDTSTTLKKIKIIESLSINTSYNIFSDSLNLSNIRMNARTKLFDIFNITFSSDYDPYLANSSKTNRINQFEISKNKRIARLKSFTTSIGININDKTFNRNQDNEKDHKDHKEFYEIPWDIQANYSLTYNKQHNIAEFADTVQSLSFSGNLKLSKNWKIGFRSGYDFDEKKLTYSSIDIYRDLHCWEMLFNWIPLGYHQSYTLTIRVKAAELRDLKYEKKKDWFTPEYN
ncbi:MAG: hypothetical protein CMD08_03435 [Flavobacteriales bacterium]|nr:hypothetical protein [Flavobacteriales bacterium]